MLMSLKLQTTKCTAKYICNERSKENLDAHQGAKDSVVQQQRTDATSSRGLLPKDKTRVEYKQKGKDDIWQEAVVISRPGKAVGTKKMCLNVQNML